MKKTKCDGVKLEGGKKIIPIIKNLVKHKIPVMGHVGILPQSDKKFTYKGKKQKESERILNEIAKPFNKTYAGLKSMLQRLRIYFASENFESGRIGCAV